MALSIEQWLLLYLKCFINAVLYYRNVYPPESFSWNKYQAFNLPRHMPITRHQGLQDYIEELCLDITSKLVHLRSFSLHIVGAGVAGAAGQLWERYILDFAEWNHGGGEVHESEAFDSLRACLNDLLCKLEQLPAVAPGRVAIEPIVETFQLELGRAVGRVKTDSEKLALDRNVNWVRCAEAQWTQRRSGQGPMAHRVQMTPVAGFHAGPLAINQHFERTIVGPTTEDNIYAERATRARR
ncbi:AER420Cp [Eremothecium gossypii ATCC 10895]|uniref:AER420Cp n=1 Tax=Eremothecium gossypii (strain ATCC 10895 / CBS 109.51 / FGSC 9923 / NRRL Y-1056) TaxID=284811 RepID=Q755U8_EREGS|nr:AER420Cp [Eremothecium gossypii ATCC 10895]AAS53099.1 AER420Cp [Eremothecium gossypii ATCC 10895]AEY97408.1 FAER420Cp [Eremothecium gossypii FDAG1]